MSKDDMVTASQAEPKVAEQCYRSLLTHSLTHLLTYFPSYQSRPP